MPEPHATRLTPNLSLLIILKLNSFESQNTELWRKCGGEYLNSVTETVR